MRLERRNGEKKKEEETHFFFIDSQRPLRLGPCKKPRHNKNKGEGNVQCRRFHTISLRLPVRVSFLIIFSFCLFLRLVVDASEVPR